MSAPVAVIGQRNRAGQYEFDLAAVLRLCEARGVNDEERFAEYMDRSLVRWGNCSPLFIAAAEGAEEVVGALLDKGSADTAWVDASYGYTALHMAAEEGHEGVTRQLVAAGAEVDKLSKYGKTPIISAAYHGRTACAKLLLDAHADPSIQDHKGKTAMRWAELKSGKLACREVAELLKQHAGKLVQARQRLAFARCGHLLADIDVVVAVCAALALPTADVALRAEEEATIVEGLPLKPEPEPEPEPEESGGV